MLQRPGANAKPYQIFGLNNAKKSAVAITIFKGLTKMWDMWEMWDHWAPCIYQFHQTLPIRHYTVAVS